MPLRPELRKFYGHEWRTVTRPRILTRAGNRCEQCGKRNESTVLTFSDRRPDDGSPLMFWADSNGRVWHSQDGRKWPTFRVVSEVREIRVVLTIAHLNHLAGDDRDENLKALCQWCHLHYDERHHAETRALRKDAARPLLAEVHA